MNLSNKLTQTSHSSTSRSLSNDSDEDRTVYIKDLRVLEGVDLRRVVIVDNQLLSFALQPDNGIPISSYFLDPKDAELRYVADYLIENYELRSAHGGVVDVREVNKQQFKLSSIIEHALNAQQMASEVTQQQISTEGQDVTMDKFVLQNTDLTASDQYLRSSQYEATEQLSPDLIDQFDGQNNHFGLISLDNKTIVEESSENEEDETNTSSKSLQQSKHLLSLVRASQLSHK